MLSIAIPNFVKARTQAQRNACVNNLRAIQDAKEAWKLENKRSESDTPSDSELFGKFMNEKPTCPAGGTYQINPVGQPVTCTIPNHKLSAGFK